MGKRITMIIGHPDGTEAHFCHALARAYEEGAIAAGHEVRTVESLERMRVLGRRAR
jgi:putative NADPH-quinone reductase